MQIFPRVDYSVSSVSQYDLIVAVKLIDHSLCGGAFVDID